MDFIYSPDDHYRRKIEKLPPERQPKTDEARLRKQISLASRDSCFSCFTYILMIPLMSCTVSGYAMLLKSGLPTPPYDWKDAATSAYGLLALISTVGLVYSNLQMRKNNKFVERCKKELATLEEIAAEANQNP